MKNIKRVIASILTVATLTIMASFVTVSASASAVTPKATSVSATMVSMMQNEEMAISLPLIKADIASGTADASYKDVVNFFVKWLKRIGALVGLIGAVMFGLAIKNNDAEQKQAGLLTMVAGFAVFGICSTTDIFHLFD